MTPACLVDLGREERRGYVLGARLPTDDPAFSPYLDLGFNRLNAGWQDETAHFHTHSDEIFVVVKGEIELLIRGVPVTVAAGQLVGIRAGVAHQVIRVRAPVENYLIRAPGGGADKIELTGSTQAPADAQSKGMNGVIRVDLRQHFSDYPLGACLPVNHPNYSPFLDFTGVWRADPVAEWKHDVRHWHKTREEYFIVLQGRLDIEVDGSRRSVQAGQILGLRPPAVHKVIGGRGPVSVLFVRVPGGRGDKVVVEDKQ